MKMGIDRNASRNDTYPINDDNVVKNVLNKCTVKILDEKTYVMTI